MILLMNIAAEMIEKLEKEFMEADSEEKEHFIKSVLSLVQTIIADSKKII